MFYYSKYWGTWSRVLTRSHNDWETVEVNITPINASFEDTSWDKIKQCWIRVHCTTPTSADTKSLPAEQEEMLVAQVGKEVADFLMHGDILSLIDFKKYNKHKNGGCPLSLCRKG